MSTRRELVGALSALIRVIDISDDLDSLKAGAILVQARNVLDRAQRGLVEQVPWTPFVESSRRPPTKTQIKAMMRQHQVSEAEVMAVYNKDIGAKTFINSRYQILLRDLGNNSVYLSIKRLDQMPIHDWRDLQRCKDELVGPECEAIELYPARSRVLDTANQYHLWAVRDVTYRFPVGFDQGGMASSDAADALGAGQRQS